MTKRNFVITAIFFFFANQIFAQNTKWENFTDFKNVTAIVSDSITNRLYAASSGGLFVVDANSGKVTEKYTNINGLVNNELTALAVDFNEKLWIGAVDGSISILNLKDNTWKYIFDIKNSDESDKTINFLYPAGNVIFAATGYGVQKISAVNLNFVDAPYYKLGNLPINTPAYSITSNNNFIYVATRAGVAWGNYVTSNLNDPNSWQNYFSAPLNSNVRAIESYDNKIFIGSQSAFYYFDGSAFLPYPNPSVSNQNTRYIKRIGDRLYFISGNNIFSSSASDLSAIKQFGNSGSYTCLASANQAVPVSGLSDNGVLLNSGFIYPNGPYKNIFNSIAIDDNNTIWVAGGTGDAGFYKFDGTSWDNYNRASHPEIGSSDWFQKIVYNNGKIWAMGFGGGPTVLQGNTIQNFNTTNTNFPLPGISNDPLFCASYGGAYDNNGVFWVSFFATNNGRSLYALDQTGLWTGFSNPGFIGTGILSSIAVDSYNTKWIVVQGTRSGVYFFNENGTLTNPVDDVFGIYDNADLGSEVTTMTDVIVDKNNEVWISTNNGVFIINNPLGAVQNPSNKPRAQKLGIISGNLKVPFTENCVTITSDILNSKWIGTETNGAFHLSSDGTTLIEQFNTTNSPILANRIASIKVSERTGKAYFGTQKGMSSYQTDAIEPVADFDKIIASPNPYVIPSGVNLKIDGLIENSIIKIITLSGEIVNEFDSPGGRIAFWDGRNQKNELASSGIYIIVAYNADGSKVGKGKVAIINK